MQTHFFNSKTFQYLTAEELEFQIQKDQLPNDVRQIISMISSKQSTKKPKQNEKV